MLKREIKYFSHGSFPVFFHTKSNFSIFCISFKGTPNFSKALMLTYPSLMWKPNYLSYSNSDITLKIVTHISSALYIRVPYGKYWKMRVYNYVSSEKSSYSKF